MTDTCRTPPRFACRLPGLTSVRACPAPVNPHVLSGASNLSSIFYKYCSAAPTPTTINSPLKPSEISSCAAPQVLHICFTNYYVFLSTQKVKTSLCIYSFSNGLVAISSTRSSGLESEMVLMIHISHLNGFLR